MRLDLAGMSDLSLANARLNRMSRIANLRKESRWAREKLSRIRSELAELQDELRQIESWVKVLEFPAPAEAAAEVVQPAEAKKRA